MLLFVVNVGSGAKCIIEWYTIITLYEEPVLSSVQESGAWELPSDVRALKARSQKTFQEA